MSTNSSDVDLIWKWHEALNEELRSKLMTAAQVNWAHAQLAAWSYLHDTMQTAEIMEEAIEVVQTYALHASPPPAQAKLNARLRSQVRRIVKQRANRTRKEISTGSIQDLEIYAPASTSDPTQALLLKEVLERLSPQAHQVAIWIWMGYSWREIGRLSGIDHSAVRLAFRREIDAALIYLGHGMRTD